MKSSISLKQNGYLWKAKKLLRSRLFDLLWRLSKIDDCRDIFVNIIREQIGYPKPRELLEVLAFVPPYTDLGYAEKLDRMCLRSDIVFVTGRFRSGSTLLWNLFRNIPSVTAYYEPFNERRWFDPSTRGTQIDSTHLNVSEYWSEYEGLKILGDYYHEDWIRKQLYMSPLTWNSEMQRYTEIMIENAKGRPVLQFNRVDLRLSWFRARFPRAKIVHIFRHPRDQWCSTLTDIKRFSKDHKLYDFEPFDNYYLLMWGQDLKHYFPFLTLDSNTSPYELFYQIWKLSYIFGRLYSDISISFEELLHKPDFIIKDMLATCLIDEFDLEKLVSLIKPMPINKWTQYANDDWFKAIERKVDETFANYFGISQ